MSFNECADKQRGGPELRPFIITSPMITLFHPVYQINISTHGLDDLQSHLISLDIAFTEGGWEEAFIHRGIAERVGFISGYTGFEEGTKTNFEEGQKER